jgi:hypothetical protein
LSTERDNALFRALVEGEIVESSAEVRRMFDKDPELEREWKETKELLSALDDSRRARREVLDQASSVTDAPGAERAERALREAMVREPLPADVIGGASSRVSTGEAGKGSPSHVQAVDAGKRSPSHAQPEEKDTNSPTTTSTDRGAGVRVDKRSTRAWVWFTAAAAVILFLVILQPWKAAEETGHGATLLGPNALEPRTSLDPSTGMPCFEWKGKVSAGTKFNVIVEGFDTSRNGWGQVSEAPGIVLDKWCPPKDLVATWPSRIRWRVVGIDPSVNGSPLSPWSEISLRH